MYGVPIAHRGGSGGGWDVWSRKDLTHSMRNCQNTKTQIHSASAQLNIKKKKKTPHEIINVKLTVTGEREKSIRCIPSFCFKDSSDHTHTQKSPC